jgi:hypothetical protein
MEISNDSKRGIRGSAESKLESDAVEQLDDYITLRLDMLEEKVKLG